MFKSIIWATDGSESTGALLPLVTEIAAESDAKLIVAHVQNHVFVGARLAPSRDHQPHDAVLRRTVDDLIRDGVNAELALTDSLGIHPARVLADLAMETGADVIIAAGRRAGGAGRRRLHSFVDILLSVTPCPVLVIPRT